MARESYDDWSNGDDVGGEDALAAVWEQARAHPWLAVAAGVAAGALLGALSKGSGRDEVRIRVGRGEQVRLRMYPGVDFEEEEEHEEEGVGGSRLRDLAQGAGEPLRRAGSAVRERVEEWVDDLPRPLRPATRMEKLRDAVSDAIPGRRPRTLRDRVKRALR